MYARCNPCEVAVRRDKTETVESTAMEKIHGVDYRGNVRRILSSRVGELLVGVDRVFWEDLRPQLEALAREIAIDPRHTRLTILGYFLKKPGSDPRRLDTFRSALRSD
jgi:hypothetical protein